MLVAVSGATGFVGRAVVAHLVASGARVRAVGRNRASLTPHPGVADVAVWDPNQGPPEAEVLRDVDAVVHLAGEPVRGRWTPARRAAIRDSRVVGTRNLVDGLGAMTTPPSVLVSASAMGYYGDRGEEHLPESAGAGVGFLAEVCQEWEDAAAGAATLGIRVVSVRIGLVLHPGGGALRAMVPTFRRGLGGRLGSGKQWWPWIHRDDLARLVGHAIEHESLSGPVNGTAPNPVRQVTFARSLASVLRRPALVPTPAAALRAVLGGFAEELLASRRCVPQAALDSGFRFEHSALGSALEDLLAR